MKSGTGFPMPLLLWKLDRSDLLHRQVGDLFAHLLGQWRGEVTLRRRSRDRDDALAGELRLLGELKRGPDVRTGGDTRRNAFELGESLCGGESVLIGHEDRFVDDVEIEVLGDET